MGDGARERSVGVGTEGDEDKPISVTAKCPWEYHIRISSDKLRNIHLQCSLLRLPSRIYLQTSGCWKLPEVSYVELSSNSRARPYQDLHLMARST
jgi:hypothetical protein